MKLLNHSWIAGRRVGLAAALLAAAACWIVGPAPAHACTPPPGGLPAYTVADRVRAAPIVLEGVVAAVSALDYRQTATIQVVQYIKGDGPAAVEVRGYGPSSLCLAEVGVGQHWLFYVGGSEAEGHSAFYLSQFDAVAAPSPQNLSEAIAASGQPPRVLQSPDAARATADAAQRTPTATHSTGTPAAAADPACAASAADRTRSADVVVEAVISWTDGRTAVVEVVQYLKGEGSVRLQITGLDRPSSECSVAVGIGDHLIFFALGDPSLQLAALNLDPYSPVAPVVPAVVDEVRAASGQPPIPVQSLAAIEAMIAATAAATDPAVQTQLAATVQAAGTQVAQLAPSIVAPVPPLPVAASPSAMEVVGLVGIGAVIGLVFGVLLGMAIGLAVGRWRE